MISDTTGSVLARLLSALLTSTALVGVGPALAQSLPTGGRVISGAVSIGAPTNGALAITQSSQNAIVNWQGFSIGQNNRVDIAQPNANAAILNRVTGSTPSTIAGQLNANGQVYLVNPNGITITRTGQVNAAGFVASTLDTTDEDFRAGRRQFRGSGASAKVTNAGTITIGRGGYAALIGGEVSNRGTISVPLGRVGLGSGERATLDLSGDGFLQVAVPTNVAGTKALVRSSGTISADGGSVILTAAAARDMARQAVNLSGTIEAKSVSGTNGSITLSGGDGVVRVGTNGRLDASGAGAANGGRVRVTGRRVDVAGSVVVSGAGGGRVRLEGSESVALSGRLAATGRSGTGGRVTATAPAIATHAALIDASGATGGGTVRIGGGRQGQGRLAHAQTVDIDAGTTIRADATQAGTGGDIVVWSDRSTRFAGTISATGGPQGGDGGQAEVSSRGVLAYDGSTILTAARGSFGTLLLDPYNITISNGTDTGGFTAGADDSVINATTLSIALSMANVTVSTGSGGAQQGNITVAAPVSWSSPTTLTLNAANAIGVNATIGVQGAGGVSLLYNTVSPTNLTFGQGASIDYGATNNGGTLSINNQAFALVYSMTDLAGISNNGRSALATNLTSTTTYTTSSVVAPGGIYSGTFEGLGHTISNLTINNTTNGAVAGLFGYVTGTIRDIGLVGGSITGANQSFVGALVGLLESGSVIGSYSTATVTGGDASRVGGLIGSINASGGATLVANSYSTGNVTAGSNTGQVTFAGGLVGHQTASGASATITGSYATGTVTSGSGAFLGGLLGYNDSSSGRTAAIVNSYATGAVGPAPGVAANSVGGLVGSNTTSGGVSSISGSFATGAVSVGSGNPGGNAAGGLVGMNLGQSAGGVASITDSFATGAVTGAAGSANGGLVGTNIGVSNGTASVATSYATGRVTTTGFGATGGFVGRDQAIAGGTTAIGSGYWDVTTSGIPTTGIGSDPNGFSANVTGLTTAQFQSGSLPTNLSSPVWATGAGLYPYLTGIFSTAPQVVSGFAYADAGSTGLSSGTGGAVTVNVISAAGVFGSATTGANGYYYTFGAAGSIASNQAALAYISANGATGAKDSVTLTTVTQSHQTGVNLYNGALAASTSETTLLAAAPAVTNAAMAVATGNAAAQSAVAGTTGRYYTATGASFTIDQTIDTSSVFAVRTTSPNAGIEVSNAITIGDGGALRLDAGGTLAVNAPVTVRGAVPVTLGYDASTPGNLSYAIGAPLTFTDSGGNGISSSAGGTLSINGVGQTLIYNVTDLQNINNGLTGAYALATNLDASGVSGFIPVGTNVNGVPLNGGDGFTGTFTGLGHTIDSLSVNRPNAIYVGLFGYVGSGGLVQNVGVTNADTHGFYGVGAIAGSNRGTVTQSYSTGQLFTTQNGSGSGGLIGENTGSLSESFSTVAVNARSTSIAGGAVGLNSGTIDRVYAMGAVDVGSGSQAGGLVGLNNNGNVFDSYATGAVSGSSNIGGFVGQSLAGTVSGAYDTTTSGHNTSTINVVGHSTTSFQNGGTSNLSAAYGGGANGLYPYLRSFYSNGVQAISGTAYKDAGVTPLTSGGQLSNGPGLVSAAAGGVNLGTVSTGANGYYYIASPNGTLGSGASVVSYTQADPGGSGARNAANVATANGGQTLANADVFGGTITQATSATSMSTALSLADARIAANSAAGNVAKASAAINATFGLGFITSGASFNVDNTSGLDTLYVRTDAGAPITVSSAVNVATTGGGLGLFSGGALAINAPITVGSGGIVGLGASLDTTTAQGVSLLNLSFAPGASIDYGATNNGGRLAVNGNAYTLLYTMSDLASVNSNLGGRYALATDLDATGNSYTGALIAPGIPYNAPAFSGTLTGLGHAIANLSIANTADQVSLGLVGLNTGTIRDLRLAGGSVATTGTGSFTGALVGFNQGVIANVSSSAAVTGGFRADFTGGLVGFSDGSSRNVAIVNAAATGAVSIGSGIAGGLVGLQQGRNGFVATIANSFATGTVSVDFGTSAGGLVGTSQAVDGGTAAITNSYANGNVVIGGQTSMAGGLVGQNAAVRGGAVASLTNVYATGPVSGATAGALIGDNSLFDVAATPLVNAYWNTTTSGRSNGIGTDNAGVAATALTTTDLQSGALPTGFSSSLWSAGNGLYPYLTSFFPNGIQVVRGTAFTDAGITPASGANAQRSVGVIVGGASFGTSALGADGSYYVFGAAGTITGGATLLAANNTSGATLGTASGASLQSGVNIYGDALTIPTTATSLSTAPSLAAARTTAIAAAGGNATAIAAINASTGRGFFATDLAGFAIDQSVAVASGSTFLVQTTAGGALTVSNDITLNSSGSLGLMSSGRLAINAPINLNGAGGVNLAFDITSPTNLSFAQGASIDYGATDTGGKLAINGANYALLYTMGDVAGVNANLTGDYALATNLDGRGTTYTTGVIAGGNASGVLPTPFSGTLNGLGHTISNLTIAQASNSSVGLIGFSTGTMRDIGIVGGSIAGFANVGSLVGHNGGGLVANAYATSAVIGGFFGGNLGGLVGYNNGGLVTNAYATGAVSGGGGSVNLGGLVGTNTGTVTNAYATGAVIGGSSSRNLGGLVGYNDGGTVANAYATGAVSGGANSMSVGGLIGTNLFLVSNGYWDTQTSGRSTAIGSDSFGQTVTGLTTRQLQGLDPINGNAFSVVNNLGDGATSAFSGGANGLYPYLASFFPGGVQAVSGFAYKDVGVTPLASGATGAVEVSVIGNNAALGTATTGANGYYYVFGAAGMLSSGSNILAFTNASTDANGTVVAKSAVTLAAAAGALIETGVNIYGDALTINTTANALSTAPSLADARTSATTAAGGDANALAAISGAQGQSFIATNGDFVIDRAVTTANTFRVQTTAANAAITAANAVTINDGGSLGLLASGALRVNAPITVNGAGAVNLAYDASSLNALLMNFSFGTGRSLTFNDANGNPTSTAVAGQSLAVNGQNYALLYSMADIDGVDGIAASSNSINVHAGGNTGLHALAHSLDASGVTYTDALIGNYAGTLAEFRFTGTFQGLGHTITGLTINKNDAFAGLFGAIGSETVLGQNGIVRDIGLIGGSVAGTNNVGPLAGLNQSRIINAYATGTASATHSVGGLVGTNSGSMMYAHATGAVTSGTSAGGLVGVNVGYIADAYATGAVRGDTSGGLVGNNNNGSITNTYAAGSVTGFYAIGGLVGHNHRDGGILNSFATGAVAGSLNVGGLVGMNGGLYSYEHGGGLLNVYATGSVIGYSSVGGLVGYNGSVSSVATVTNAYATGAVSGQAGGSNVGGLVGTNDPNGTVIAGYFDRQTTGQGAGIGLDTNGQTATGLTTAALQNGALPAGFDPAVWTTGSGLYSYLASFFPNGVQVVSGTAYADAIGTPLASNAGGAVTVNVVGDGNSLGSATTGANGYYYAVGRPGTITDGAALLAYTNASSAAGVKSSVTLANASGTPVNMTSSLQTGVNLYNGAFATSTNELTLLAAEPTAVAALNAALTNNLAALPAAVGVFAVPGSGGRYYTATGASFTIDTPVTTSSTFAVSTAAGAPLTVASPITINTGGSLGLLSGGALAIDGAVNVNGAGSVALAYDASSPTNMTLAQGASIDYGATDQGGALTINGNTYTLLYSMADVQQQNVNGFNAIATNLDASATSYASAVVSAVFDGTLEGLGHTISNLTITGNSDNIGLIGRLSATGTIRDIGLLGGSVSGYNFVGGLVGFQAGGTISNVYTTGTVRGINFAGGLVGLQDTGATIGNAYATGAISGGFAVGGLVGQQLGAVSDAFATGAVTGGDSVGGLVGSMETGATISNAYSTGAVTGAGVVGGLVGNQAGGTITNSYYDAATTGRSVGSQTDGSVGLTTAQLQNGGLPSGFGATIWDGATGGLYPYLASFFPNGVQAVSGFAYKDGGVTPLASGANGAATVSIAGNGQTLGLVTTGANGYYYSIVPAGTLAGNGVAAYTQADMTTGSKDAVSYAGYTPGTVTSLDISGDWRRDTTFSPSLSALDAGFAATSSGTPVAGFTLPNRSIFSFGDFTLDTALSVAGTLNLASIGTVTQTSAFSADTLLLEGSHSTRFSLTDTGNQFSRLAAAGGAIDVVDADSLTISANVANACNCVISGVSATGTVRIATAGDLTIATGVSVSGDSPMLSAVGAFINDAGANAVSAASGRWLVYSADSATNVFGGLDSANTAIWNTAAGAAVMPAGNRYIFSAGRTLTVTTLNDGKTYGEDITGRVATDYTVTGFDAGVAGIYRADTAGTAFTGVARVTSAGAAAIAGAAGSPYAITASRGSLGSDSGYDFSFVDAGMLTVDRRGISVMADAQSRIYGDADPALTYVVGGLGLVNGDELSGSLATLATASSNVGTYSIVQDTLAASQNYMLTYVGANLGVTARALMVTANAQSRLYGEANPALTYTVGGMGLANGDALTGGLATSAAAASDVGRYAISQGNLGASSNYAVTYVGADLAVTPRTLTLTADAQSRVYGEANPALTYTVGGMGLANRDALTGGLATSATAASDVGRYAIAQGNLAASSNYAVTYAGADLVVTPRTLTLTVDAQSRVYGEANPVLTYTVGGMGLANGDLLRGTLATTATGTSDVGRYAIAQGNLGASSNYAVTYAGADLAVTPRALTLTADAQSRAYGEANPALTYTVGGMGLANGDLLRDTLATIATGTSDVGRYAIAQGNLAASSNYAVTYAGADLSVTPRALTLTADAQMRAYGEANPLLTYTVGGMGLTNGDLLRGTLATTATGTNDVGRYAISQGNLGASSNYAVTYAGADLAVTPRALTLTADAQSRVYGEANPALTYTVGGMGLANGDALTGGLATSATAASEVGRYAIAQGNLGASSNYAVTYVGADLSVTPRALTLTADAQSRVYGEANPTLTYTVGGMGLANGDLLSGTLATIATGTSGVGPYAITQGSLSATRNYALTYQGAVLTVTSARELAAPAIDATGIASTVTWSLRETGILPFGAAVLPGVDPEAPSTVAGPTLGFAGITDPRFQGIVVCVGGQAGACFPVPVPVGPVASAPRP